MFDGCSSLISLPNISLWNTSNVVNMESLFFNCSSLLKFPDISIWKTDNLKNIKYIFECCNPICFPHISRWNVSKVKESNVFGESSQIISNSGTLTFSKNTENDNSSKEFYFSISNTAQNEKGNSTNNNTKEDHKLEYHENEFGFNYNKDLDDYYDNFYS